MGAIWDARTGKIPNRLTFPMMAVGLGLHAATASPLVGLLGLALATLLHLPLWILGVEKAGDTKLIMGVGACGGWPVVLVATGWLAALYLPIGLVVLYLRHRRGNDTAGPTWMRTGPLIAAASTVAIAMSLG